MPMIVPIVEGDGDVQAVPSLIRKVLQHNEYWHWQVAPAKKAGGLNSLRPRLSDFLRYAQLEPGVGATLVLLDLDDGCAYREAQSLAINIRNFNLPHPVAVVFACREYEAWFLASLSTIAGQYDLPEGLLYEGDVEARRGAKEWLSKQMPSGRIYKETIHQVSMTQQIDLELARQNSRSFRRLCHAIEELVQAADSGFQGLVTPVTR
jgi:hypothetical protein